MIDKKELIELFSLSESFASSQEMDKAIETYSLLKAKYDSLLPSKSKTENPEDIFKASLHILHDFRHIQSHFRSIIGNQLSRKPQFEDPVYKFKIECYNRLLGLINEQVSNANKSIKTILGLE